MNAAELNISMGKKDIESITLKTLSLKKKKTIYILAYTSPQHGTFIREVPKKFFSDIYIQAKKWRATFSKDRRMASATDCESPLDMKIDKQKKNLCLDKSSERERKKFFRWFNEQAQLAMIIIR